MTSHAELREKAEKAKTVLGGDRWINTQIVPTPDTILSLLDAMDAVRKLHRERYEPLTGARWCEWCDEHGWPDDDGETVPWPCPTRRALDGGAA